MTKRNRFVLVLLLSLIATLGYSQDTTYYKRFDSSLNDSVEVYEIVLSDSGIGACVYTYDLNDNLDFQDCYSNYETRILGGESKTWYENGQLKERRIYEEGTLIDTFFTYWPNGQLRREEVYEHGSVDKRRCLDSLGSEVAFFEYSVSASYSYNNQSIGGYIGRKFPDIPYEDTEECGYSKLKVAFVVEKDGSLSNVKVINAHCYWDSRIVKMFEEMPKWNPSKIDGVPVRSRFVLPIRYKFE